LHGGTLFNENKAKGVLPQRLPDRRLMDASDGKGGENHYAATRVTGGAGWIAIIQRDVEL
jgi:hypothetical protein